MANDTVRTVFYACISALLSLVVSSASATLFDTALLERNAPANPTGVKTITSPGGATIRYKEPGKDGVCETTSGVNSYSGYVDLDENTHMFFWFFEARHNPANAPLTLWLNGGPGSDSLLGLFQELGPCNITQDLKSQVNPYSWTEVSNILFLSQPIGVGFSYSYELERSSGRYGYRNISTAVNTTDLAAVGTWHVLQGFLTSLPTLDSTIKSKTFNLWTESYGGHYGPSFFDYFEDQNAAIANGTQNGTQLILDTLGIGNGIIDETIQAPYYPEFAVNNTYGIKAVNDTIYLQMKAAYSKLGGCKDGVAECAATDRSTLHGQTICAHASNQCRTYVEGPYYLYANRGVYDIRHPYDDPTPPQYFVDYLNQGSVQQALGVNLNYTAFSSSDVEYDFLDTGDFVFPTFLTDLEHLLNNNVRVALYYGDADYICNWFGGQALSLAVNYVHATQFRSAGYAPFTVNGTEYGAVRQYGNFSFLRMYEAGHEVPYYQPLASLEFFRRVLANKAISDGVSDVTGTYGTGDGKGDDLTATHTEPYAPLTTGLGGNPTGVNSVSGISSTGSTQTGTGTGSGSTPVGTAQPTGASSGARRRVSMPWRW